jgi:hypothetical protein
VIKKVAWSLASHLWICAAIYVGVLNYWGPAAAESLVLGFALGVVPVMGVALFSEPALVKKAIALIVSGSVLRYLVLLLVLAILIVFQIKVSPFIVVGLASWMPSAILYVLIFRRSET